jgi:hypothetical protein
LSSGEEQCNFKPQNLKPVGSNKPIKIRSSTSFTCWEREIFCHIRGKDNRMRLVCNKPHEQGKISCPVFGQIHYVTCVQIIIMIIILIKLV